MFDFFTSYRDYYDMVHVDSPIFEDISTIQQFKSDFNKYLNFYKAHKKACRKVYNFDN